MNLNHPPKTSIDEYTDSKSRETPRFVFFILKFSVALYLYDLDLYKTQKAHKKTREESLQNFGVILIVILNFLDVAQKRL